MALSMQPSMEQTQEMVTSTNQPMDQHGQYHTMGQQRSVTTLFVNTTGYSMLVELDMLRYSMDQPGPHQLQVHYITHQCIRLVGTSTLEHMIQGVLIMPMYGSSMEQHGPKYTMADTIQPSMIGAML